MEITVTELKAKLDNNENVRVIDVREPYEYEEFNIGGELVPLGTIQSKIVDLEEYIDDEIVIHCRSGARNVKNLKGGMLAWQEAFGSNK